MIAAGVLLVIVSAYFLTIASCCSVEEITYSIRLTGCLFGALIVTWITLAIVVGVTGQAISLWRYGHV